MSAFSMEQITSRALFDPEELISAPGLAWQAALEKT